MSERRLISSGGPWEARYGYSRAVAVGDECFVSGTTDAGPDGRSLHPGDAAGQARAVFGIIERALGEAGTNRLMAPASIGENPAARALKP